MADPFIGEIKAVGFNFAPQGYAFANGALLSVSAQTALYSLLSTFFGGDGVNTFGLPNLQSRVPIGMFAGGSLGSLTPFNIGVHGGAEYLQLSLNELPTHIHGATTHVNVQTAVSTNSSGLGATTTINALTAPTARAPSPANNLPTAGSVTIAGTPTTVQNYAAPGNGTAATMAPGMATTTITGGVAASANSTATAATSIDPAGTGQPFGIRTPFLAINYIIALEGVYPTRN
jgi:microcystin-dependent protein